MREEEKSAFRSNSSTTTAGVSRSKTGGAKLTNTPLPAPSTSLPPFPPRRQLPQLQHPRVHPPPRQGALPRGSDSDRGDDGGGDGSRRGSSELARGPRVLGWPQGARGREEAGRARADVPQAAAVGDGRDEHRGAPEEGGRERGLRKRRRRERKCVKQKRVVFSSFFFFDPSFSPIRSLSTLFSLSTSACLLASPGGKALLPENACCISSPSRVPLVLRLGR